MANTSIEWTDKTWNPIRGCSRISSGCKFCYAERLAARGLPGLNSPTTGQPFAIMTPSGPRWTGKVELIESKLLEPLEWKKPCRVFVNSMSDLFHADLPDEAIDRVFAVMALTPHITYQVLTKRADRLMRYFRDPAEVNRRRYQVLMDTRIWGPDSRRSVLAEGDGRLHSRAWTAKNTFATLLNVWLGVSVEDQATADERIPNLLQAPAAVRFVSYEPALGPVNFRRILWKGHSHYDALTLGMENGGHVLPRLDWIICGGESGPGARPMHPDWARSVRDQCQAAGVAFFFKQWGEWGMTAEHGFGGYERRAFHVFRGPNRTGVEMLHLGKAKTGRLLDGRTWDEFPKGGAA
jgi:protein gp37